MIRKKIVAYLRLSREDGDDESSSITNQRKILSEYAEKNNIKIDEFYVDDGYSGYTMERPDFNRLKEDLNNDEIDTIIVKDLSRLGRHNAKVQLFLENIIEVGKRVVALGDNYDTYNEASHDMVGVQTWMNEKYVRDVSKKVRKSVETMQKEGRWITGVPYGYMLDPFKKGYYYIDPLTASYVGEIFDMYLNGMGYNSIAINLTKRNVPTATMLTKQRIEDRGQQYRGEVAYQWAARTVKSILTNDFYTGTLTLGKTKRRSINGKKIKRPEEEHYVFEDAHEAIISKRTFQLVQELIIERAENFRGVRIHQRPNIFAGVLYCADCGHKLTSTGKHMNTRYVCSTYNRSGSFYCKSHGISESNIKEPLLMFLKSCRENLGEALKDLDEIIKPRLKEKNSNVPYLEKSLARLEEELQILINQKMRETKKNQAMADMIDDAYSKVINEKYIEIKSVKTMIEDQKSEVFDNKEVYENMNAALKIFDDILASENITKKQIATIVDKIVVHEDSGLDIYLKGDLHELCTNYIQFKASDKQKIIYYTIEYIEKNPTKIVQSAIHKYCKAHGCRIRVENYKKILQLLVNDGHLVSNGGQKKGYRLATSIDELKKCYLDNIVGTSTPWLRHNNVTYELIEKINKWINSTKYKKQTKKLF
jgi:DNA invertase Pin-like site-specific DNA recombinase